MVIEKSSLLTSFNITGLGFATVLLTVTSATHVAAATIFVSSSNSLDVNTPSIDIGGGSISSGSSGDIHINTGSLSLIGATISSTIDSTGSQLSNGGNITITTSQLTISPSNDSPTNGATIIATGSGAGDGGNVTITATDSLTISDPLTISPSNDSPRIPEPSNLIGLASLAIYWAISHRCDWKKR